MTEYLAADIETVMMPDGNVSAPDSTAVRVALWRALHLEVDSPPHVLEDPVGLRIVAPDPGWRSRPDMDPNFSRSFRASIVGRARFIEDLVIEQAAQGVDQYVILGAGLDTFAQRRPEIASRLMIFEVDQPGPQAWKQKRLRELGMGIPPWLRFVPVDFETESWWQQLLATGFDAHRPAIVASTGVSLYLTREANFATLRQIATLAPGSTLAMSYLLPIELADPQERAGFEAAKKGAQAGRTPFLSFFTPEDILALAREAGFREARAVSAADLIDRYFASRPDSLRPGTSEEFLVAKT